MTRDDDAPLGTCASHDDKDLWFAEPSQYERRQQAVAVCHECPVLAECRAWAIERWPLWGARELGSRSGGSMVTVVVGGLTELDVKRARKGLEPLGVRLPGRARKDGQPQRLTARRAKRPTCELCGEGELYAKGVCRRCYHRAYFRAKRAENSAAGSPRAATT